MDQDERDASFVDDIFCIIIIVSLGAMPTVLLEKEYPTHLIYKTNNDNNILTNDKSRVTVYLPINK